MGMLLYLAWGAVILGLGPEAATVAKDLGFLLLGVTVSHGCSMSGSVGGGLDGVRFGCVFSFPFTLV